MKTWNIWQRKTEYNIFCTSVKTTSKYSGQHILQDSQNPRSSTACKIYEKKGFPDFFGAIDCPKLFHNNFRTKETGQHQNTKDSTFASVQRQSWCVDSLYCWHWNVGRPVTCNDINVFMRSGLLMDRLYGCLTFRLSRSYYIMNN